MTTKYFEVIDTSIRDFDDLIEREYKKNSVNLPYGSKMDIYDINNTAVIVDGMQFGGADLVIAIGEADSIIKTVGELEKKLKIKMRVR